jgi:hypothetical protein
MSNRINPSRVTTEEAPKPTGRLTQPIDLKRLQTTISTVYTATAVYDFVIRHLWAANIDSSARTLTVHMVPSGGTASDANCVCKAYSIPANTTVRLDFLAGTSYGSLLQPSMSLQALCSSNNAVNIGGWGQDVVGFVL